jgi:hypothetical protein
MPPSARSSSRLASKRLTLRLLEPELHTRMFMEELQKVPSSLLAAEMET